jgi:RNA polymerase sigma factor (sigma-70 family)
VKIRASAGTGEDAEALRITSAIRRGDPEAFAVLYGAWFDRAYAIARSLTRRDESTCLDVVQDAMLRAVRSLRPIGTREGLDRWMARVVRTAALDRLRRESRRARPEARAAVMSVEPEGPGAFEDLEAREEASWLRERIGGLPERDRPLLEERFDGGKTLREAGTAVGLTGPAAHGRIRRIIEGLRRAAREAFGG